MNRMLFGLKWALVTTAIAAALTLMLQGDHVIAEQERQTYCYMVGLWEADARKGMPERERSGWPPFRGKGECKEANVGR